MNKRKLSRKNTLKKKKAQQSATADKMTISKKARETAKCAVKGKETVDCIGNFIFFSTTSGEAWMLDHRENFALRLANKSKVLPYKIIETQERFAVEWKERFKIENNQFIASRNENQSVFKDYPTKVIEGLITILQEKNSSTV